MRRIAADSLSTSTADAILTARFGREKEIRLLPGSGIERQRGGGMTAVADQRLAAELTPRRMNRSSRSECCGSENRRPCGSLKTVWASSNQTPCLIRLLLFFRSSPIERSYLDNIYIPEGWPGRGTADATVLMRRYHTQCWYQIWYDRLMGTARKITVEVPQELLDKAQRASGTGITQTVRTGLQLVAASRTYARLRQLRGKVRFARTLAELKADR
jgi:hypothetical protein